MTERAQTILTVAMAAYTSGWLTGLWAAGLAQRSGRSMGPRRSSYNPDWRRSFNHENTNRPSGPPPLLYQSRSQGGPTNPPPRNP